MAKDAKEFTSTDLKVPDNSICVWTNAMDDTLIDAYCQENSLGHRVDETFSTHAMDNILKELKSKFPDKTINKEKIHNRMKTIKKHFSKYYDIFQTSGLRGFAWDPITNKFIAEPEVWDQLIQTKPAAADLRTKPCRNYEKLMMLYGKDRATGKHAETGLDMLKRSANKNLKKSNVDPLTIDEVDEMIYTNAASLENIDEYGQSEQSEATDYAPTHNVYLEAPTPIKNKISNYDHLESMVGMLRGGMDKLASAISGLSSAPPISESEIWNMLAEMNL